MDKLIFLDIDGVVNTYQIDDKPFNSRVGKINRDGFYINLCSESDKCVSNTQAIMWLNKLCKETKAKIVITSTWRLHGPRNAAQCLRNSGLYDNIEIIGHTPNLTVRPRGDEIKAFLDRFPHKVESFVILDDDSDMGDLTGHLVQCNTYNGFLAAEYFKALEILKK